MKAVTFPFKLAYLATAIFSFSAAIPVSAATVSLDGTWQAEAVPEARGEVIPAAFTRTIPVPGHWPLMKPAVKDNMSDALWCRTTWKAPTELPPRVTLRIGKASFGTTVFVNGKRAGFFPYNFIASETEIRPFLMPAPKTRSWCGSATPGCRTARAGRWRTAGATPSVSTTTRASPTR